ncbi:MAG: HAD family hydrolase [Proteobacteria bacterium]|nr:HAD family hydrolase [Pseudomonadota bacterium]
MAIKNIFWDVDGVLANLNFAYFNFLKNHPNWRETYKELQWADLPAALPIGPKYGALELKSHPTLGDKLDYDFCHSLEFFNNRPLYPDAIPALRALNKLGYRQITASATFDVATKTALLKKLFADALFLDIECVRHGTFMSDTAKENLLKYACEKYGLDPRESVLVDDRIYNLPAAMNIGMRVVRMRSEFTTDSPAEFKNVPEVRSNYEFVGWLIANNN